VTKRKKLVTNAQSLSDHGIECDAKYLPLSLKQPEVAAEGTE
jgi:hypothetical protein